MNQKLSVRGGTKSPLPSWARGLALCLPLCLGALLYTTRANAQTPAPAAPTPQVSQVVLTYQSVLSTYKPWSEQAVASWPQVNARVAQVGGWRAYALEAAGQAPAEAGKTEASKHSPHHPARPGAQP